MIKADEHTGSPTELVPQDSETIVSSYLINACDLSSIGDNYKFRNS